EHVAGADRGAARDGDVLDQLRAGADGDLGPDDAEGADFRAGMDPGAGLNDGGGMDGHLSAKPQIPNPKTQRRAPLRGGGGGTRLGLGIWGLGFSHYCPSMSMNFMFASATSWPSTVARANTSPVRALIFRVSTSRRSWSPGTTLLRSFTPSSESSTATLAWFSLLRMRSTPASCAMASICRTPGMIGWPGKWPWKKGSLKLTFLIPTARR